MTPRQDEDCAGFTLIEAMAASVVFAIVVLTLVYSMSVSMRLMRSSSETDAATTDLALAMETLHTLPTPEIPVKYPPDVGLPAFEGLNLSDETIIPTYPGFVAGEAPPDPLEIILEVEWRGPNGDRRRMRLASVKK